MAQPEPRGTARSLETGLSPDEIRDLYPEFARLLKSRKNEIIPRQDSARSNLDEQLLSAPGDDADISVIDTSADYFLNLANAHQRELIEIRDAFDRMDRGVYGVCESCELPISVERLRKLPTARLCIECQSTAEKGNAVAFPRKRPTL